MISQVWKHREEEIIQECIEEAFRNEGYQVRNVHKADRSHENGADLICNNPDEKVAIQVKKKPVTKDTEQLERLSNFEASRKIYVYVEEPTVGFKELQETTDNVEFWDIQKLHGFLINGRSTTYYRLLFLSSEVVQDIINTIETIISTKETARSLITTQDELGRWFVFKDRAVKLHGSTELIYEKYKGDFLKRDTITSDGSEESLNEILLFLNYVHNNSSTNLLEIVKGLKRKHPSLLSKFFSRVMQRSNWSGCPEELNDNFRHLVENFILPYQQREISFYNLAVFYLKKMNDVAEAIEDGVDWVFEDSFGFDVVRDTRIFDSQDDDED